MLTCLQVAASKGEVMMTMGVFARFRESWLMVEGVVKHTVWIGFIALGLMSTMAWADQRVEKNVVYGMYSGLALLMDVHFPEKPNGHGLIVIPGSAWRASLDMDGTALKDEALDRDPLGAQRLLDAGYTLFPINHRATPRFSYPAAVEDAQRAVQFVRRHARRFGIDPDRIGAVGGSSGGHLVSMLGTTEAAPAGTSSKVQAVVALYPATDLYDFAKTGNGGANALLTLFTGAYLDRNVGPETPEAALYREASPVTYVSNDDAPFLLIHGDQDQVVPFSQSERLRAALIEHGVTVELMPIAGGGHGDPTFSRHGPSGYFEDMVRWFDRHLRQP